MIYSKQLPAFKNFSLLKNFYFNCQHYYRQHPINIYSSVTILTQQKSYICDHCHQKKYNYNCNVINKGIINFLHILDLPQRFHSLCHTQDCQMIQHNDGMFMLLTPLLESTNLSSKPITQCGIKIYTKTGDGGTSSTYAGQRHPKNHELFEALGTIDELSAHIGLAKEFGVERSHPYSDQLERVQCLLQDIAVAVARATVADEKAPVTDTSTEGSSSTGVGSTHVEELENWIDTYTSELPPLKNFILPVRREISMHGKYILGGGRASAGLHVARTICRRAERALVTLMPSYVLDPHLVQYINRLSDYLFTIARYATVFDKNKEVIYINPGKSRKPNIRPENQSLAKV